MRTRCPESLGFLTLAAVVLLCPVHAVAQNQTLKAKAQSPSAIRPWNPPLTPDGQPDLQGVWSNNSATPLERPRALEGKASLTDEEVARLKTLAEGYRHNDSDAAAGDSLFLATLAGVEKYKSATATGGVRGPGRARIRQPHVAHHRPSQRQDTVHAGRRATPGSSRAGEATSGLWLRRPISPQSYFLSSRE